MAASTMCGKLQFAVGRIGQTKLKRCTTVSPRRLSSTELAVSGNTGDETAEVAYPSVKPKFPPGSWGDMERMVCWQWHDKMEEFLKLPTVSERLNHLKTTEYSKEFGTKVWSYYALENKPELLEFQQNTTKTVLIEGLPDVYSNMDQDVEELANSLKSVILETLLIGDDQKAYLAKGKDKHPKTLQKNIFIKSLLTSLVTALGFKYEHLFTSRFSQDVRLEASWDRYGIERWKPEINKDYDLFTGMEYPHDYVKFGDRFYQLNSKFQGSSRANFQLRTERPLPEFASLTDDVCTKREYPTTTYWPGVLGQSFDWSHLKTCPGYNIGDPNQFGYLTVQNSEINSLWKFERKFGEDHAKLLRRGQGMNNAFLWTVSQAYYQGFNTFVDITYPFTSQSIVTDGQKMAFFAYQLNTLHLWKNDEANPLRNVCWYTEEEKLYDVIENGEVKGFNDNVFKKLLKFLIIKPVDRGYDLKPTLPDDSSDREKKDSWLSARIEEEEIVEEIQYDQNR